MKSINKIILILSIFVVVIIITMIIIKVDNKKIATNTLNSIQNQTTNNIVVGDNDTEALINYEKKVEVNLVKSRNDFFSIENMVNNYLLYLKVGNSKAVYSMLDMDYISTQGITEANVLEILRTGILYDGSYKIKEAYVKNDTQNTIYYIYGILEKDLNKTPYYLVMYQDALNMSFAIKPITSTEYSQYISEQIQETNSKNISLNEYNKIVNIVVNDEDYANKYFNDYIHNAKYYPEEAYRLLNEEYRNSRFGSLENYKAYLVNKNLAEDNLLTQYSIHTKNNVNYCVCIDKYNNTYVFEILGIMNYKLILDTYTLDLPEFIEQYEEADDEGKIILNIKKIFEALNEQDYKYVYNKLDEEFKTINFADLNTFSTYMSSKLYKEIQLEYIEYTKNEEEHKYILNVKDKTGVNTNIIQMTIIMKLGENTDFSFKFE